MNFYQKGKTVFKNIYESSYLKITNHEYTNMDQILQRLESIEKKLDTILENQQNSADNINKMGTHIDFVEGVYERVKSPMYYICDKLGGKSKSKLISDGSTTDK